MQIREFNANTPQRLAAIIASGEPELITYERTRRPYARVMSDELYTDLIAAAGARGQEVLAQHRAAKQQEEDV